MNPSSHLDESAGSSMAGLQGVNGTSSHDKASELLAERVKQGDFPSPMQLATPPTTNGNDGREFEKSGNIMATVTVNGDS